MWKSTLQYKK